MRVAVIGSRRAPADAKARILAYLPPYTSEIVSGGAAGIDEAAAAVAKDVGIPLKVFAPDYNCYGKRAPLVRNDAIIDYADMVLAFWDGQSHGTKYVIGECIKKGKRVVYIPLEGESAWTP